MSLFVVVATIVMVVSVFGFVLTNTVLNPSHIKNVVITDESVSLANDFLNGIVLSTLEFSGSDYHENFFDDEFTETFIEDMFDTIVFGKSDIDTAYYDDYINDELFPRIEEITGIDVTENDKLGIMEKISGTLQNKTLSKVGNFFLRRIANGFRKIRGLVMGISIGAFCTCCQIYMFMFFAFRNRFIAIKDFFLSCMICFASNLVFFVINQLILNSIIGKLSDSVDSDLLASFAPGIHNTFSTAIIVLASLTAFSLISFIVAVKLMRKRVFVVARLTKEEKRERKLLRRERKAQKKLSAKAAAKPETH